MRATRAASAQPVRPLLAFGTIASVRSRCSIPERENGPDLHVGTAEEIAALASRASISGVQPKMLAVQTAGRYHPASARQAKHPHRQVAPRGQLPGIVELEYLTTKAAVELLPGDRTVTLEIAEVSGVRRPCPGCAVSNRISVAPRSTSRSSINCSTALPRRSTKAPTLRWPIHARRPALRSRGYRLPVPQGFGLHPARQ